ncbi:MAG: TIGR03013 family PEP-CTERM/XrtA system glycosyltransferase [Desulfobacterales bacterium]|nr:TIGR03013 family PEP-CTERM/XrtA system glycosyltransferase [Desulfobacterales bacterium]
MLRLFKQYYPIRNIFFVLGEGLAIYGSLLFTTWIFLDYLSFPLDGYVHLKIALVTIICQTCLYYNDLYDLTITNSFSELGIRLLQALGVAAFVLAAIYFLFPETIIGRGVVAINTTLVILLIVSWRIGYTQVLNYGLFNQKIIILGSSDLAGNIIREIGEKPDCGYVVTAVVTESEEDARLFDDNVMLVRKGSTGLRDLTGEMKSNRIVVALKEKRGAFPAKELLACRMEGIDVLDGNTFYEMLTGKLIVEHINPAWLIYSEGFQKSLPRRILKRIVDLILSFILLVILFPVILATAILIRIDSRGPVFFSQDRVGEKKKEFSVHKFRSMVDNAEKISGPKWATEDDNRITRVGAFIRKTRIDEIPQLWNVLKGEMSFVGPRPERDFFVKKLQEKIPYYSERFYVKPGLTGWAQVSYGYGASVDDAVEKLNYELFYIKNMSIFMDLMIVFRTVKIVLFGKGR